MTENHVIEDSAHGNDGPGAPLPIVERLRDLGYLRTLGPGSRLMHFMAADAIERPAKALEPFACDCVKEGPLGEGCEHGCPANDARIALETVRRMK